MSTSNNTTRPRSPVELADYLSSAFTNVEGLWLGMEEFCCLLSGSRALAFFIPGSTTESSDWDFYTFPDMNMISGMIRALRASGTTIEEPAERAIGMLDDMGRRSWTLTPFQAHRFVAQALDNPTARFELRVVAEWLKGHLDRAADPSDPQAGKAASIRVGNAEFKLAFPRVANNAGYSGLQVIEGYTHNGQKVQLMFAEGRSPLDHILRFHSSAVQCFLSTYAAGHLYGDLASQKEFKAWPGNAGNNMRRYDAALDKYVERGFKLIPHWAEHEMTTRMLAEESGSLRPYHQHRILGALGVEPELFDLRRRSLVSMMWQEHDTRRGRGTRSFREEEAEDQSSHRNYLCAKEPSFYWSFNQRVSME